MCSWDAVSLSRKTPLFWHFRFFDFLFCFFCGDEISWHGLKLLEGTKARLVLGEVAASPMLASGVLVVRVHVADKEDRISVRWKPQPSARRKIFNPVHGAAFVVGVELAWESDHRVSRRVIGPRTGSDQLGTDCAAEVPSRVLDIIRFFKSNSDCRTPARVARVTGGGCSHFRREARTSARAVRVTLPRRLRRPGAAVSDTGGRCMPWRHCRHGSDVPWICTGGAARGSFIYAAARLRWATGARSQARVTTQRSCNDSES